MTTVLTHRLIMRYKVSRSPSPSRCTDSVPPAPTLNYAPVPSGGRNHPSRRKRNRQPGASLGHLPSMHLQSFRGRRDGDPMGLTSNRSYHLAQVLS